MRGNDNAKDVCDRLQFEMLLFDISARFVNLPLDEIDNAIEDGQRQICECLGIDLSALWQWSGNSPNIMALTHLYSPPDGPERPESIDARDAFPWALQKAQSGEAFVMYTENMPPEAARDQETRRYFGIKSSVAIPLSTEGEPYFGILSFDSLKEDRFWPDTLLQRLDLLAQVFASTLARRRVERKWRESQMRLRMATEFAGVGLWDMDVESGNVWATPQTRALFYFGEEEGIDYDSFNRMIDPEDRERVDHTVQAAIQSGERLHVEFRIVPPDGKLRWIRASGKRLEDSQGNMTRLLGASIDISEHRQMADQLRIQLEEISSLKQQLENDNIHLRKEIEIQKAHEEIIGRSPEMIRVLNQIEQVANTDATVLIEGETGTGKELLARALHKISLRKDRPLVTVNCAALPPTLVESELFGREKGAYTGALTRMTGRFELADRATLFLDEIGELPLEVQAKLLRVIEEGRFERLGSTQPLRVDTRIIAATNQNLEKLVNAGKFRKDLYFRLNVFPIHLPPLRERPEDVPPLVWHFVRHYEEKMGKRVDHISRECMNELQHHAWPGNIRELRNMVERSMIVCSGRSLDIHPIQNGVAEVSEDLNLIDAERRHITGVLKKTGWRISGRGGAAELLGIKRTTLQSRMKKLGIQRPPQ